MEKLHCVAGTFGFTFTGGNSGNNQQKNKKQTKGSIKTVKLAMLAIAIAGLSAGIVVAADCTGSPQCTGDCSDLNNDSACAGNNECSCALDYNKGNGGNSVCSCGINHD